jgi:hypothetical protein
MAHSQRDRSAPRPRANLRQRGPLDGLRGEIPILIIEHDLDLPLADPAYVLDHGQITDQSQAEPLLAISIAPAAAVVVRAKIRFKSGVNASLDLVRIEGRC